MSQTEDQQFCLRWNNFQANITSQFETLRDDEDFTDVTIACEGQRIQAHKVVLSACSPFFKELFKTNPCSHPIIFMRDVESRHILALMEFMYAGEVNVSQAHLSTFLKTAESLKIRGLTDTSSETELPKEEDTLYLNPQSSKTFLNKHKPKNQVSTSTVTSSQDLNLPDLPSPPPKRLCKTEGEAPKAKKDEAMTVNPFALQGDVRGQIDVPKSPLQPKVELPDYISDEDNDTERDDNTDNGGNMFGGDVPELHGGMEIIPQASDYKLRSIGQDVPHQSSDNRRLHSLDPRPCAECGKVYSNLSNLRQHMKLIHYPTYVTCPYCSRQFKTDLYLRRHVISAHDGLGRGYAARGVAAGAGAAAGRAPAATLKCLNIDALSRNGVDVKYGVKWNALRFRRRRSTDWLPYTSLHMPMGYDDCLDMSSRSWDKRDADKRNRLVKLADGIEIFEDQLRSLKWSDYRKLTRGLATILFSPAELATCSVTGQRWSRAGSGERPVKPALDRAKVQAIISYVATRFPMVEISRIKQVLAYKCKENSTAFKMKAVRYYGEQHSK